MQPLEVRYDHRVLRASIAFCIGAAIFSVWAFISYPTRNTMPVGVPIGLAGAAFGWWRMKNDLVLRLSPEGLEYPSYRSGPIPWDAIESVEAGRFSGQFRDASNRPMFVVHLKDPARWPPSWWTTSGDRSKYALTLTKRERRYRQAILITRFGFDWDFSEIERQIHEYRAVADPALSGRAA